MEKREFLYQLFPLLRAMLQVPYLVLDALGVLVVLVGSYVATESTGELTGLWATAAFTAGSALLTVGLSLPVAIFYQTEHNAENFRLLRNCDSAGIRTMLVNRSTDEIQFRQEVDGLAKTTSRIQLIGVAFRSLFDPDHRHTSVVGARISSVRGIRPCTLA